MENTVEIKLSLNTESRIVRQRSVRNKTVEQLTILDWYRILRAHHQWTIFQAIRFALWLSR